ncbi:MAG: hypothetical protein C3F12_06680 [Candidatus Methylomirabilota bacterium]|nr:MAG: hypothetical protein C3F12_06680 [candidate division NC10 bacterium]
MTAGTTERRLSLSVMSSSCGLSCALHALLALAVVYGPQWFYGKPFKVPLNYEVTLVSPRQTDNARRSDASLRAGPRAAATTATAKAAAPPRDLLALPSPPKAGLRSEDLVLSSRRRTSERSPVAPAPMPQAPPRIVAPQVAAVPTIAQAAITVPTTNTEQAGAGQSPVGGTETGVMVGNGDPALAYYFVLIQDKITSNWTPPKMSPGATASVSLSLRILRSGQVRGLAVGLSSGDRLLDDSALRAVGLSNPLPPLPPLYKAEALSLDLRFTFVGEKS